MKWTALNAMWCLALVGCGSIPLTFPADSGIPTCAKAPCVAPLVCDVATHTCVECDRDADCAGSTPACDLVAHRCLPCRANFGCAAGLTCSTSSVCVKTCTDSAECPLSPGGCAEGVCAACVDDSSCAANQFCSVDTGLCVACREDGDCASPTPHCQQWSGTCVACQTNADCGATQSCFQGSCR